MRKVEVTGCKDCPFFWFRRRPGLSDAKRLCVITYEKENTQNPTRFLPSCPLKDGGVKVEIKTQGEK